MTTPSAIDPSAISRIRQFGGEDMLGQLVDIFDRDVPIRLATARQAAAELEWQAVADAVHSVKSTAGNLGASQLQALAQELERVARRGDRGLIEARLDEMDALYRQALAELHQLREAAS